MLVFIVGASRSGTTMLNRVLGNHSCIAGLNELHYFGELCDIETAGQPMARAVMERAAAEVLRRLRHDLWGPSVGEDELRTAREVVAALPAQRATGAGLIEAVIRHELPRSVSIASEQTPRNVFYADRLLELFPDARVINIVRDPRAVLASQKFRWRRRWLGGDQIPWSQTLRVWANYHPITMSILWKRAVIRGLEISKHPRATSIRYEELVADPRRIVGDLCSLLGVCFEQKMLEVPIAGSSNRVDISKETGVSADGVERWRDVLSDAEIVLTEIFAGTLMSQLGYHRMKTRFPLFSIMLQALRFPLHLIGVAITNPRRARRQFSAWSRLWGS